MYDSFAQNETDALLQERAINRGPVDIGWFEGMGEALKKAPGATYYSTMRALSPVLDAYGKSAAYSQAPMEALLTGKEAPDMKALKAETIERMDQNDFGQEIAKVVKKDYTPDPATTGRASQAVFDIAKIGGKALGYWSLGGLPGAVLGTGMDEGSVHTQELMDQGVDTATALKAGAVHGVATGASIAFPATAVTRLGTAGLVAVSGPGMFMAEQAAINTILESANYDDIAAQYDPTDPFGLLLSTVLPAAVAVKVRAGKGHTANAVEPSMREPTSDEFAAAHQLLAARQVNAAALVDPRDIGGVSQHVDLVNQASRQIDEGEPVSVAEQIDIDPHVVQRIVASVAERVPEGTLKADDVLDSTPTALDAAGASREDVAAAVARLGDELVPLGDESIDGAHTRIRASELATKIDALRQESGEARAYQAAVDCFLRIGV